MVFVELSEDINNYGKDWVALIAWKSNKFIDEINYLSFTETKSIKKYNKIKHIRELSICEIYGKIYKGDDQELIIDWILLHYKNAHILDNWIGTSYLNYFINIEKRSDFTNNSLRMITFYNDYYSY